ncbi:hypothetical protein [Methylomonas sp. 11b]|uniref:hypothetical protein n=1 Tax=Methylomonas sp. 11b TaxID=1168169 RepID=UPI000478D99B|nr:hypothetical protein [Methylomonas sp. 11b]
MKMYKSSLSSLLLLGVIAMFNLAEADETLARSAPPTQYPLAQVAISILHQTGHGIPGGYEIAIQGDGNGFYLQNALKTELHISSVTLIDMLNDFYRIHFFELADTYQVKKQVLLRDNFLVATTAMKMADTSSKKLCIQLADYQKCVTIVNDQPAEAAQLITKIEKLFVH